MASTLRDRDAFERSLRNYEAFLDEAGIPGGCDVDLTIERRGNHVVFEGKPWRGGVTVPVGQYMALRSLSEKDRVSVVVVGETGDDDGTVYIANLAHAKAAGLIANEARGVPFVQAAAFRKTTWSGLAAFIGDWYRRVDLDHEARKELRRKDGARVALAATLRALADQLENPAHDIRATDIVLTVGARPGVSFDAAAA